jgi:hypothetical protein
MQLPSTNPDNPKSNNASPDLGMACPPKRYIGPSASQKVQKSRRRWKVTAQ